MCDAVHGTRFDRSWPQACPPAIWREFRPVFGSALCPAAGHIRIESTRDLWPLAAETAKEPSSRSEALFPEQPFARDFCKIRKQTTAGRREIGAAVFLLR